MKNIFLLTVIVSLVACGGDDKSSSKSVEKNGTFTATMGDKNYELAVRCHQFDNDKFEEEFTFASDNIFGSEDTDGDGIIVRGDKIKLGKDKSPIEVDGISLTIVDHGVRYSADPMIAAMQKRETWTKTSNGISGTDKMSREDATGLDAGALPISYEVVCK